MREIYLGAHELKENGEFLTFAQYVRKGKEEALEGIRKNFELNSDYKANLPFHNSVHAEIVGRRAEAFLKAIGDTPRNVQIGGLLGYFHDVVQDWHEENGKRVRHVVSNETKSFEAVQEFMKKINGQVAQLFGEKEMRLSEPRIMVTVPGWNPSEKTVVQPNLNKNSDNISLAIAVADINSAGINPWRFRLDGDNLFREENLDLLEDLREVRVLSEEQMNSYRNKILAWTESQLYFAKGRKNLLPQELSGLPEKAQISVLSIYARFDESIEMTKKLMDRRSSMTLPQLVADIGYKNFL